jgi:hypothetical protein
MQLQNISLIRLNCIIQEFALSDKTWEVEI